MIAFELTMPNRGSWNGKWTGDRDIYARVLPDKKVPKEYVGKNFYYSWDDGWTACVSTYKVTSSEANLIRRKSKGFYGYDWMIESICEKGKIEIKE